VTDRTWKQAEAVFGPLDGDSVPTSLNEDWQAMHGRLVAVAALWTALPPGTVDGFWRPPERRALRQSEAARGIHQANLAMIREGQLVVTFDLDSWRPAVRANSLRAFLLADCAAAIGDAPSYRRCRHCTDWFALVRSDALFCSPACRQAAYSANKARDD
jgi:hypothetical protein